MTPHQLSVLHMVVNVCQCYYLNLSHGPHYFIGRNWEDSITDPFVGHLLCEDGRIHAGKAQDAMQASGGGADLAVGLRAGSLN